MDLINQINAILKLSFPINSIKLDINHIQKLINQIDSVESSNVRINDSGVLLVEVIERKPVAVYRENDDLALIDLKGYKINKQLRRYMKDINAQEYNELLSSEAPVVIDFHATWCGPCKVLSPILEELSSEVDGETLSLISDVLQSLNKNEFFDDLFPISNATGEGMVNLESALSRIINLGEEVED